jgi:tetratricopeptide (TPR) repeat protein
VKNLVGLLLAVTCVGYGVFGQASALTSDDTNQVQAGTLNPLAEKTSEASALYALALGKDAAGDHAGALEGLRQVVALDPSFTEAQVKLAAMLLANKQPDEAYQQLKAAQAAHADQTAIDVVMAQVEQARGHDDQARQLAEGALARQPSSTDAMNVLLELGRAQKDLEASVGSVIAHLQKAQAPVESYLALLKQYMEVSGEEDPQPDGNVILRTVLGIYRVAAQVAPQNIDVLSALSDTQNQLGQNADALATLLQAQKLDPQNIDLMMHCAALATDAGNKDVELAEYKQAYALDPARVRASLATTYFENQQYDKALDMMKKMLGDTPNDPMLLIRLGVTCEAMQKMDDAHGWFEKALHSPSLTLEAAMKLTAYFIDGQRTRDAMEAIAISLKKFPTSPDLHFYAAAQDLDAGRNDAALAEYRQARDLAGGDPSGMGVNFYLRGAQILAANGLHHDVDPLLDEGLQRYPDDPNLLNQQAWELEEQNTSLDRALASAQKAVSLAPDDGSMADTLGCVYLKLKQPDRALPVLQQAAKMTNNEPSVCQHLGDAYLAGGRRGDALNAWKLGLKTDPTNRELTNRITTNETSAQHASSTPASP